VGGGREQTEKVQDLEAGQGFKRECLKCYVRGKITIRNVLSNFRLQI